MIYSLKLKTRVFDFHSGVLVAVMNENDALDLSVRALERVEIINTKTKFSATAVIDITKHEVKKGEIGLFEELRRALCIKKPTIVEVKAIPQLLSVSFIRKKVRGEKLSAEEIKQIVNDIDAERLSELEISALMTAVFIRGFDLDETVAMTQALIENGKKIEFKKNLIVDKHCIGGINGRTSLILVPIVAAAGLTIPKTASKAITSAAGTADSMECLANVSLSINQLKKVVEKTNACIAWGGSLDLAPVDDKIIRVEYPLKLDPEGQIIASVMAKKASVGAKFVVIDLPVGPDVKVQSHEKAKQLAEKFVEVGKKLGLKVEVLITDGSEPSGPAFGPALEARHALQILEGKVFDNLAQKACELSGALFELCGVSKTGEGFEKAREILQSGMALKKMTEIIEAQNGKRITSEKVKIGSFKKEVFSKAEGIIKSANLKKITTIAREAGAPSDKGAGVLLKVMPGEKVKKGQLLFEIYSNSQRKLEAAENIAEKLEPLELEKIIIEKIE